MDAPSLGYDAGQQARAELARVDPGDEYARSWLYGFLSGFLHPPAQASPIRVPDVRAQRLSSCAANDAISSHTARVLETRISKGANGAELRAVSLDVDGLALAYRPGDELALLPCNSPDSVREVLRTLGLNPQTRIRTASGSVPAWQALLERVNLECISTPVYELMKCCANTREEREAIQSLADSAGEHVRPLLTILRRFPRIRPDIDQLLQALSPILPVPVPIASVCVPEHSLDVLTRFESLLGSRSESLSGYAAVDAALAARCRVGEWLTFSVRNGSALVEFEPLAPVVFVSDCMGAAVVRAQLQQRELAGHRGRNWIVGIGAWDKHDPYAADAAEWMRNGSCRSISPMSLDERTFETEFRAIEEILWRWLVDRSRLYVAIADPAQRDRFTEQLCRLVTTRARLDEIAGRERLKALQEQEQIVFWRQAEESHGR